MTNDGEISSAVFGMCPLGGMAKQRERSARCAAMRPVPRTMSRALLIVCSSVFMIGWSMPAQADQLAVNGHHYAGARVVGFTGGRIEFRTAGGESRQADIAHIEILLVERGDAFADLNQAERYASTGEWGNALLRYKRAARLSEGFWSDVIAARMLTAADRAKRIDESAAAYLRLLRADSAGPVTALSLFPRSLPTLRDAATTRALQQLDNAVAANPGLEQRLAIDLLGYEILRAIGDPLAAQVGQRLTEAEVPTALRLDRVYAAIRSAMEQRLSGAVTPEALLALNRAMTYCPSEALPDFLLLKGKTLLREAKSREELIRASWAFLRVTTHMPEDPRAAEALLGAAKCLERLGRKDQATVLLRECLARPSISDATTRLAKGELERLAKL